MKGAATEASSTNDFFKGTRALEGSVGSDDAGEIEILNGFQDGIDFREREVWSNFKEHGDFLGSHFSSSVGIGFAECAEEKGEVFLGLQVTKAFGIGATDVDGKEIGVIGEELEEGEVFIDGFINGDGLRFSDVDAERNGTFVFGGAFSETFCDDFCAIVVESEAVDDGFVFDKAVEAGFGVARLALESHGSDFDMAETEGWNSSPAFGVFVESRCKTDTVGESDTEEFDGVGFRFIVPLHEANQGGDVAECFKGHNNIVMGPFSVLGK